VGSSFANARLALAILADAFITASESRHAGRRHHGHQRQDHHGVSHGVDF
jgi:hypothetical protein